jgi:hypothetical protein
MLLKCIKQLEGLTIGKSYKLLGCAGEYVQIKDDNGQNIIINEIYFSIV